MASEKSVSSAFESISRHFECGICTDRYKDPKILDCLHTFCVKCLQDYINKTCKGSGQIVCPICRAETQLSPDTGARGLKTNFHMVSLMEELALHEKLTKRDSETGRILCEICKTEEEATHRCLECAQNLCADCGERHSRIAATSTHTVSTLEEIRQGKVQPSKRPIQHPTCPNHEGEIMRFFCTTCKKLICRDCTVVDHPKPEHVHIDRNQAVAKYKQSLTELLSPLDDKLKKIEGGLVNVSKTKRELTTAMDRLTAEVRNKADQLRQEVTRQERKLVKKIKGVKKGHKKKLDATEKACQLLSDRIQHSLEITRDMTSSASDSDFLALYPTIINDMKSLSSQNTPEVDTGLPYPRFRQGQRIGEINLGELVTSGTWELCREFGKHGSGPGEFNFAWDIAVRHHDEIAVTDVDNHRVQIFGVDETYKCQIHVKEIPRAIAVVKQSNRLIVVCQAKVKVFNQDNSLEFEFSTVPPDEAGETSVNLSSAAMKKDGNILVGDLNRRVLTEHSTTDSALLRTIPVGIKPLFLAVGSDNKLVISSLDEAVVHVTDGDGTTLFSIKPTIGGQPVEHCAGVWSDHSGLYIGVMNGEQGTGHIHHYDAQGAFLTCIAQGLLNPLGITMTPAGQIAVADFNSVKIYH